jgi:hypothetical protein
MDLNRECRVHDPYTVDLGGGQPTQVDRLPVQLNAGVEAGEVDQIVDQSGGPVGFAH